MSKWIMVVAICFVWGISLVQAQQTFEQVWQSQWRSQVSGNFISRRFEPQLKAACKEVWDTAQANVVVPKTALAATPKGVDESWVRQWCQATQSTLTVGKNNDYGIDWIEWRINFPTGQVLETDRSDSVFRLKGMSVVLSPEQATEPKNVEHVWASLRRFLQEGALVEGEPGKYDKPSAKKPIATNVGLSSFGSIKARRRPLQRLFHRRRR